ncbi:MAG: DUF3551 domain-containing protein [Xanthobacteraceae bacterium]|jgi:Protein of unknown function (DUF3551)
MRIALAVAMATVPMLLMPASAQAQNYPWCAEYGMQGTSNCGFVTAQQCMAALSGNGGYCAQNPMFRPGPDSVPPPRRARR